MSNPSDQQDKNQDKKESEDKQDDTASATIEDVKRIVNEAVESVKELFDSSGDSGVEPDSSDKTSKEDKPAEKRIRRSYANIEADARRMVEEQVHSVLGELEHKKDHENMKKKAAPVQKAPIKVRRSTKFWLGKDYGNE